MVFFSSQTHVTSKHCLLSVKVPLTKLKTLCPECFLLCRINSSIGFC